MTGIQLRGRGAQIERKACAERWRLRTAASDGRTAMNPVPKRGARGGCAGKGMHS